MRTRIKVMIAHSHPLVCEGVSAMLGAEADMELVGRSAIGLECMAIARQTCPDVVLVHFETLNRDGLSTIREIKAGQPTARFLILSNPVDDDVVREIYLSLKADAVSFLLNDVDAHQVVDAIRLVYQGTTVLHPKVAAKLIADHETLTGTKLTRREKEVLELLAKGLQNKEIALRLGVTEQTVLSHVRNIFRKLGLSNRTEAALYATKHGLG